MLSVSATKLMSMDPSVNGSEEVHGCSNFKNQETLGCSLLGFKCPDVCSKLKNKDNAELVKASDYNQRLMESSRNIRLPNISQSRRREREHFKIPTNRENENLGLTFEYYVGSEQGINLEVDLSSSPLDWIKKLNDGVCIHPEDLNNKSWALHDELRNLGGGDEEVKAASVGNTEVGYTNKCELTSEHSSLDLIAREGSGHVKADQTGSADRSSMPTAIMQNNSPFGILRLTEEEDHKKSPACDNGDVQKSNMLIDPSPQSCEETDLSSEAPYTSQIKLNGGHVIVSKSEAKISLGSEESENGKTYAEDTETGSAGTSGVPHVRSLLSSSEVPETIITGIHENGSRPLSGSLRSGDSMDMQLSEVVSLSKDMSNLSQQNGGILDLEHCTHGPQNEKGSSATHDLDLNESLDPSSDHPEEQQRSNPTNEMQSLGCSQFDTRAKNSKRPNSDDCEGLQNKRQRSHAEGSSNPAAKNFRRGKGRPRKVLPRRSKRLVSK